MNVRKTGGGKARLAVMAAVLTAGLLGCAAPSVGPSGSASDAMGLETAGRYVRQIFAEVGVSRDLVYASKPNESGAAEDLKLDLYEPGGDTLAGRPAVIFVHGGGFTSGDKAGGIEQMLAERLARKGYVTLSINYRLRANPSADWPSTFADASLDAYSALQWLMEHSREYRVDAGRIAFGGHSAGSNIVTELCYSDWSGKPLGKSCVFGVVAMAGPQMVRGAPVGGDPFCILIHGTDDVVVPYALSENLAAVFDRAGTRYVLYPMKGLGHDLSPAVDEIEDVITQYLYKELTGKDPGVQIRKYAGG